MFNNIYKGKKVFVTGHTGFKGSWLTQWLLSLGADVKGYSLYIPSKPSLFEVLKLEDKIDHFVGDIRDLDSLQKSINSFKPDMVFHLAAQPIVRRSYDEPILTFETNLIGTINILETIRSVSSVQAGIFITSDKCYENVEWEYGYRETDKLGGKDPYSASKACTEIAFSSYHRSFFINDEDPKIATTRAGNVIGGGDWADDRIVPDCIRAWSENKKVAVRNPSATRPWQHVLEPLSGYLWLGVNLLENPSHIDGEAFNFGPNSDVVKTVLELLNQMKKKWNNAKLGEVSAHSVDNKKEAGLLKLNCDKALRRLQWEPSFTFKETMDFTVEWYKEFYREKIDIDNFTISQIYNYQDLARQRGRLWAKQL